MSAKISLPKQLKPYREVLEKTIKPYIKITTKKEKVELYQSKFGGNPYLPKNFEHPKDTKGNPMILLAQLNFEEIPQFENMPQKVLFTSISNRITIVR